MGDPAQGDLEMKLFYPAVIGGWLLVGAGAHALAADLAPAYKASPLAYPLVGSGFYWGINAEAGVAQSNVNGNALFVTSLASGNLVASGGSIGGTIGWLKGSATSWIALQASVNYTNISGSVAVTDANGDQLGTVGVRSKWSAEQVIKIGGFPALFGYLPNFGISMPVLTPPMPVLPAGYIAGVAKPYFMAGVREFDANGWVSSFSGHNIGVAPLIGMGMVTPLVDSTGAVSGAALDTYAKVIFPGRGFSVDFTSNNPTLGGGANMGTQYVAGMAIYY